MAPKKGGKGGRPRKYTIEEAQAAKQAQDRQRQHRLQHAQVDNADPDDLPSELLTDLRFLFDRQKECDNQPQRALDPLMRSRLASTYQKSILHSVLV